MSLRNLTVHASRSAIESSDERLQELYSRMNDIGVSCMTTEELEEWSYLMAESLEGKGDPVVPISQVSIKSPKIPDPLYN
jgi:hypothetical protein